MQFFLDKFQEYGRYVNSVPRRTQHTIEMIIKQNIKSNFQLSCMKSHHALIYLNAQKIELIFFFCLHDLFAFGYELL